ncbi:hypothetical protein AJ80_05920 [Polytolypa hystricis UAMH7299]|uniref:Cation-transporting P-type ATPase C-terminal domain-containing protein n=1 Tax=Polytolypa hystricis (strain UAMH7299) TaxID=1447883 RepID=A0A2B7XZV4_POLH7|nr:hypothetical protein AJ80_05920 [Polytolypa hystricis UAMH7299]
MWKVIVGEEIYQLAASYILHFAGPRFLPSDNDTKESRLPALVFNTFMWMQTFNLINNRRVDSHVGVFWGIRRGYYLLIAMLAIIGGQITIMFVGGTVFSVHRLNGWQWGISLVLGAITIPVGMILRCIPDRVLLGFVDMLRKLRGRREQAAIPSDGLECGPKGSHSVSFITKLTGCNVDEAILMPESPYR